MRISISRAISIVVVLAFFIYTDLNAQNDLVPQELKQQLRVADAHLLAFRNDSAIAITEKLLKAIKARNLIDTPFGIRVQLAEAMAYENDEKDDLALKKLLHVEQQSKKNGLKEIHAKTCLGLALLYEKNGRKESSLNQLKLAKADIDRYALDSIFPYYAIRKASWERLFGHKDTGLYFAWSALHSSVKYKLVFEEAIAHMLLNMLLPESAITERMQHSLTGVKLYQQLGDHTGTSYMFGAIASLYFQQKHVRQALAYNDSTIISANRAIAEGNEQHVSIAGVYRFRSEIYKQMGLLDSAMINLQKGYKMELDLKEKDVRDKIAEIDARYQTKYKEQLLEENQLALRLKSNQLRFSIIIVCLVSASALVLFVGYRKQRKDKRKLIEQNTLIHNQATKLKVLDETRSRFFANVSHELRTPLALMLGPVSTLLNENRLSDKQTSLLRFAHRSGKQLEQLVTDILDLGKIEMGKMDLNEKPTQISTFFSSHFAQFESLADSRNLHYSFDVTVPEDAWANLDQIKYRQILNNLLNNAFKFTLSGGQITTSLVLSDATLQLRIADTGSGVHPDDLPHIFDRYYQTMRPNKSAGGGTGIGLALCREYVQLMGGKIGVASVSGSGSTFQVDIPIVLVDAIRLESDTEIFQQTANTFDIDGSLRNLAEGKTGGALQTAKPTILVVEDNLDLQAYINLILSEKYRVVTAENGKVALEQLRAEKTEVSLILSDLMMPVMDGYQLLEQLKSDDATRHIPVIMLTARADAQDKLRALRIGVDDYLLKPFEEEELLARIDNLLVNRLSRIQAVADESQPDLIRPAMSQADREWLELFEEYVQEQLGESTLTVPALAHQFAMSESTLLRQLKRLTGLSPNQYVQTVRLECARRLLEKRTYQSIAQIAAQVGYEDVRSFSRSFRTRFGKLPSELVAT